MPEAAVSACGLTKRYREVTAVDGLSLRVEPGEIYALLGLNGAGKTTTIRTLLGMITPTAGTVAILGTPVAKAGPELWSQVGYLVETPAAYPDLTVRENLEVVRRLRRLPDRSCVEDIMDRLALGEYAGRRARHLSLGNAQRLGLAKALVHRPALLILDEPANGLDPAGVVEIRALLHDLATVDGVTIFLSSHILTEVTRLATRIGILRDGALIEELDVTDLARRTGRTLLVSTRDQPAARDVLVAGGYSPQVMESGLVLHEESAVDRPEEIATLLVRAGCPPTTLLVEHADLETYFLSRVGTPRNADA